MPQIKLAVVSDLHCRLRNDPRESFLIVGESRRPNSRHPVSAALDLIRQEALEADVLLLPGDFANRASPEGLSQGWDFSLEIGRALGAGTLVPVIGNHDIDSRRQNPAVPVFSGVQNLRDDFPFTDATENMRFFAEGYALLQRPDLDIIAINTVIDHTDEASAKRGTFGVDRIERMELELASRMTAPLRIAVMHHHPLLHTGTFLEDTDVLATGDRLLAALRRLGCRLVVHGHRHFARLSYVDQMAVLASGSFSAQLFEYGTSMGNTFHLITLEGSSPLDLKGQIRTWVFRLGKGWKEANEDRDGFPFVAGFGRIVTLPTIVEALVALASTEPVRDRFTEEQVMASCSDVAYLTPTERADVNLALHANGLTLDSFIKGRLELWRDYIP